MEREQQMTFVNSLIELAGVLLARDVSTNIAVISVESWDIQSSIVGSLNIMEVVNTENIIGTETGMNTMIGKMIDEQVMVRMKRKPNNFKLKQNFSVFFIGKNTQEVLRFSNFIIDNIVTSIKVNHLKYCLETLGYDKDKSEELIDGSTNGFELGYEGEINRQDYSNNIPLKIGTSIDL